MLPIPLASRMTALVSDQWHSQYPAVEYLCLQKQAAAESVDHYSLNLTVMQTFRKIFEMSVSRLHSQKTACRFRSTDDHLGKGENNTDQYSIDGTKRQHSPECAPVNQAFLFADFPQTYSQIKFRCPRSEEITIAVSIGTGR